jgi:hypothetical protein
MNYSKEDQKEYAGWLKTMIAREAAKPSSVFTLINIYGLNKDLQATENNLSK